jgi:hypothetical protein
MKLNLKSMVVGFVIACVLLMSFSVFASDGMSYLGVFKDASAVFINNARVAGTNFLWNEKTYVAIEDVAATMGLNYSKIDGNISVAGVVPTGVTAIVPTPTPEPTIEPLAEGFLEEEPTPTPTPTPEPTPEITPEPTPIPEPIVIDVFIDLNHRYAYPGPPYYYIQFQDNDISTGRITGIGWTSRFAMNESTYPISAEVRNKLGKRGPIYFELNEDGNIIKIWH